MKNQLEQVFNRIKELTAIYATINGYNLPSIESVTFYDDSSGSVERRGDDETFFSFDGEDLELSNEEFTSKYTVIKEQREQRRKEMDDVLEEQERKRREKIYLQLKDEFEK